MNNNEYMTKETANAEITRLQSEIDNCNRRIDDIRDSFNRSNTMLGIAIGLFAILLAGLQVAIAFLPYITNALK